MDIDPGPGVDVVADITEPHWRTFVGYRLVVCTETIEHVADWRTALDNLGASVRVGGWLILTGPGPGFPYHPYPIDRWRFTLEQIGMMFRTWHIGSLEPNPEAPGFLLAARRERASVVQTRGIVPQEVTPE